MSAEEGNPQSSPHTHRDMHYECRTPTVCISVAVRRRAVQLSVLDCDSGRNGAGKQSVPRRADRDGLRLLRSLWMLEV